MKFDREALKQTTFSSFVSTGLTVIHSLRTRGLRHTIQFAVLGIAIPVVAEYAAVNSVQLLRHHMVPQVKGVPLGAALGWYNIAYPTFAMIESVLTQFGLDARNRRWAVPLGTAVTATSLDLILDCAGLDFGLWEWTDGGSYASDITGPNAKQGIPLVNFNSWLAITSGVTLMHLLLTNEVEGETLRPGAARSVEAGRTAAFLLLPYYLGSVGWALQRRKPRYLLYSALFPVVLTIALKGRLTKGTTLDA